MRIISNPKRLQRLTARIRQHGKTIGFVPTMGALHAGHLRLIRRARRDTDCVVVSIFVNPTQFNQRSDYEHYPRPRNRDVRLARSANVDFLFTPPASALYPKNFQTSVNVTRLTACWEGTARPGHFPGVATIITKLFHLVRPTIAYFGEKDAQQARVIQQLVQDLNFDVAIRVVPTARHLDGLAMSSRNTRLSPSERRRALVVFRALQAARRLIESGERRRSVVVRQMGSIFRRTPGVRLEYAAVVDPSTLEPVARVKGRAMLLIAAWVGKVRLIDTLLVKVRR